MSEASAHAIDHHEPVTSTGIPNKKVLMWAFLGSDCMFFGTLISTHLIYRKISATVGGNFLDIRDIFDIELTSFSTFILLASSLFMALAVSAIHKGNLNSTRWMLFGTIVFGAIFLACQVYEFTHFVHAPGHELTLSSYQRGSSCFWLNLLCTNRYSWNACCDWSILVNWLVGLFFYWENEYCRCHGY
jgi:cytochrome o ubiquinol oxidase subunit 3